MAPPLTREQLEILNKVFYEEKLFFGRDKLYAFIKEKYDDYPSRRQIAEWLQYQYAIIKVNNFVISKIIKPVIKDNVIYYEVKWKGYTETTLEPREVLLKDVPKMINQFEKKNKISFYENINKRTKEKTLRFRINNAQ